MLHAILRSHQHWPLHGVAASRSIETDQIAQHAPHALMQRAGRSIARLALAVAPHAQRIWVAAGPGNNGGDGLEAALHLQAAGRSVEVSLIGDPTRASEGLRAALRRARDAGVTIHPMLYPTTPVVDLAIDALLGLGLQRPALGEMARAIALLNDLDRPRLAVDLPSALNGDTGQRVGTACVRASVTLSLLTLKPGLFTAEGRDLAGDVWFDDLDTPPHATRPDAWLSGRDEAITQRPGRQHAQHKGSFGDVIVVGGAAGMGGAVRLAASAALAAGAGRVYLSGLDAAEGPDAGRLELMHRPALWQADAAQLKAATVVCGCGGGDAVAAVLPPLLAHAGRLVLDADALNAVAADAGLQALLAQRQAPTLLTPHPLEAARLLGSDARQVQADRLGAAQTLAAQFACTVVLKGSGSVIAAPGQVAHVNASGNAALATAGTGDVLAGWLGGAWSQGRSAEGVVAREAQAGDVQRVAAAVVWRHGAAAEAAVPGADRPLRAADLIEAMLRL